MTRTRVEVDAAGKPVRLYHEVVSYSMRHDAGQGVRESWTHPIDDPTGCKVCQKEANRR